LRTPHPGALWPWVKAISYLESAIFAALLVVWLAPEAETATFVFGMTHGIGYLGLCVLIWIAAIRRECPYWVLAATLTPVGPFGSVIAIHFYERRLTPEAN
jgi:hypothetical protein